MKRILDALDKAASATALHMQEELRQSALAHGWDPTVVANTHVVHHDGQFHVQVHPKYEDAAHRHEFGTETSRPTAVIRKFNNNPGTSEKALVESFFGNLGGRL